MIASICLYGWQPGLGPVYHDLRFVSSTLSARVGGHGHAWPVIATVFECDLCTHGKLRTSMTLEARGPAAGIPQDAAVPVSRHTRQVGCSAVPARFRRTPPFIECFCMRTTAQSGRTKALLVTLA
jgi:hypothetical protein